MRTPIFKIIFALTALALASCDEWDVQMDTQVMRDGSCVRTVTTDDDGCLTEDEGWDVLETKDSVDVLRNKVQGVTVSRKFERVEDMNGSPALQIFGRPLKSEATLDRKFKWFYTDYTFTETFRGWEDSFNIPITDYLSQDEASFWFTGYPELPKGITGKELDYLSDISCNAEHWAFDVMWDIYFRSIAEYYDQIGNPPVDRETFLSMRDTVMKSAYEKEINVMDFVGDNGALEYLDRFFNTNVFTETDIPDAETYGGTLWYQSVGLGCLKVSYTLKMPGKVIDAGRGQVEDGVIQYRFGGDYLITGDYTFTASSRCANVWAFLLSGLIVIIAVGSFFIKR